MGKLNRVRRNKGKKIREKIRKKHRRIKQRNKKNLRLWSDCKRQIVSIILLIKYGNVFVILLKDVTNMIYLKIIQNSNYSSFNLRNFQFLGYFLLVRNNIIIKRDFFKTVGFCIYFADYDICDYYFYKTVDEKEMIANYNELPF